MAACWKACSRVALATLTAVLAGCAAAPPAGEAQAPPATAVPLRSEISGIPFHPADEEQCGPAALATALGAAGISRRPSDLRGEVFLPGRRGSLQVEMLAATRRAGLLAYRLEPNQEALYREIAAGNPVVVLQNVGFSALPAWHYAVVIGYDLGAGRIYLRSGGERRLVMDADRFDDTWRLAGRWAFLALPPDRLPASATEADFVAAAASLEAVAPAAAAAAYRTALREWPGNAAALLGLGNVAYRQGDMAGAATAFERATREIPDSGDAWNNLAQVRLLRGERSEARTAARRAIACGGPRRATYAATLAEIDAAAPPSQVP